MNPCPGRPCTPLAILSQSPRPSHHICASLTAQATDTHLPVRWPYHPSIPLIVSYRINMMHDLNTICISTECHSSIIHHSTHLVVPSDRSPYREIFRGLRERGEGRFVHIPRPDVCENELAFHLETATPTEANSRTLSQTSQTNALPRISPFHVDTHPLSRTINHGATTTELAELLILHTLVASMGITWSPSFEHQTYLPAPPITDCHTP